mmetsp:Transcript_38144/g.107797  ORF Transcript_38144/g.107797 Transcript_38144/m.107797 type:complete len:238 (-) Transcript_38144:1569-2282(-)
MGAPNPVASAASWRRRVAREEQLFADSALSNSGKRSPEFLQPLISQNTLGIPVVRLPNLPAGVYSRQPSVPSVTTYQAATANRPANGRTPPTARNGGCRRRNITGSIVGCATSAASMQRRGASAQPSRTTTAQHFPSRPPSNASWAGRPPPSTSSYASSSAPPFRELSIPSRRPWTPASQCSYPVTPNFSSPGSTTTTVVMRQLEDLERQLAQEHERRLRAEEQMQSLMRSTGVTGR